MTLAGDEKRRRLAAAQLLRQRRDAERSPAESPASIREEPPAPAAPAGPRTAPLSFGQQRLWFFDRLDPGAATFNLPVSLHLAGRLRADLLARAFGEIVRRHEALRTTFGVEGGEPFQLVHPPVPEAPPFPLPVVDLAALPAERARTEAERRGREAAGRPFDLAQGPLLRTLLFRLAADDHVAVTTIHHIVSDGWSLGVLVREVGLLYGAFAAGLPSPLPELPTQYADFAVRQRALLQGKKLAELLGWWRKTLDGAPQVLELPADHPRPPVLSNRGAELPLTLPDGLLAGLRASGLRQGATLFMTLLAGFAAVLGRWAGKDDLLISSPVAGRSRPELEGLIGFFVNDLTLRCDLTGDPAFGELVRRLRSMTLGALTHQDLPFERLVEEIVEERSRSRHPLTQVVFAFQNTPTGSLELPGLTLTPFPVDIGVVKVDLNLSLEEGAGGQVTGVWEVARDLFDPPTIHRLSGHLRTLLAGAVEDPECLLSELPLMPDGERHQVLVEWNQTATDWPRQASLGALFAEQAARRPATVALIWDGGEMTWGELERRSARMARQLRERGPGQPGREEERVGLLAERSPDLIAGLLGIVRAGGACLPLDPSSPPERLAWMLDDAGARLLLVQRSLLAALPPQALPFGLEILVLEDVLAAMVPDAVEAPLPTVPPEALASVLYTSGSTGMPKGVAVTHANVIRLVRGADYADLGPEQVWLQYAPLAFDASTLEIWAPLLNGGRLALMPAGPASLDDLARAIARHGVTSLWLTAGLFHQMVDSRPAGLRPLRQLLAGGDTLSPEHARRVLETLPGLALIDGYGPTEGTTFTCCHRLTGAEPADAPVPIGRPIANARVYVLDEDLHPTPIGVPGELYAGGEGLTRGYLGRPDLTAERFVPDPFSGRAGERLYRTGDQARWRPGGTIEFLGRLDGQVKIRGFRVETGEVEAVLARHPAVRQAAVMARERAGSKVLAAWLTLAEPVSLSEIQRSLREKLPEAMIPTEWVVLDELPLTSNGKIDRRELPAPEAPQASEGGEPRTPIERDLVEICAKLLGLEKVGIHDNFFDLGGHSLLATQLVIQLSDRQQMEIPLRLVFDTRNLAELAEKIVELGLAQVDDSDIASLLEEIGEITPEEKEQLLSQGRISDPFDS